MPLTNGVEIFCNTIAKIDGKRLSASDFRLPRFGLMRGLPWSASSNQRVLPYPWTRRVKVKKIKQLHYESSAIDKAQILGYLYCPTKISFLICRVSSNLGTAQGFETKR